MIRIPDMNIEYANQLMTENNFEKDVSENINKVRWYTEEELLNPHRSARPYMNPSNRNKGPFILYGENFLIVYSQTLPFSIMRSATSSGETKSTS